MPLSVRRTYEIAEKINALIREPWEQSRQHNYPSLPQYKQLLKGLQPLMTEIDFVNNEFYPDWLSLIVFGPHACVSRFYSFLEKSGSKTTLPSWYNSTTQRILDTKQSFVSFLSNSSILQQAYRIHRPTPTTRFPEFLSTKRKIAILMIHC